MADAKTRPTETSVEEFIDAVPDERQRADSRELCRLMSEVTGHEPVMWGTSIVGFGSYHYTYASGREGDWMMIGFSPRKATLTIYLMDGFEERGELLARLGKHKTAKSCLHIKRLDDVDQEVLEQLVTDSYEAVERKWGQTP